MHCCPGPHGATFSSEHRPETQQSRPAGYWPSPGSHPGPGVHESPPQSSSASHTAEKVVFFQSLTFFFLLHISVLIKQLNVILKNQTHCQNASTL